MEKIMFPDDTLPGFDYLDQLSDVSESSIETAINEWEKRYSGSDSRNILDPEVE